MQDRLSFDEYFLEIAKLVARRSTCLRMQVGVVIADVNNKRISTGYNGVGPGQTHCSEHFYTDFDRIPGYMHILDPTDTENRNKRFEEYLKTDKFRNEHAEFSRHNEFHGEQNAIVGVSKQLLENGTMYMTHSPCYDCAKLIVIAGIKRVVFVEIYDRHEICGLQTFDKNNVEWEHWKNG